MMRLLIDESIPALRFIEVKMVGLTPLRNRIDITIQAMDSNGPEEMFVIGRVGPKNEEIRMMVKLTDIADYVAERRWNTPGGIRPERKEGA